MSVTWSVSALSDRAYRLVVSGAVDLGAEQPLVDAVGAVLDGARPGEGSLGEGEGEGGAGGGAAAEAVDRHVACEIDLAAVTFIDSSGVRALVRLVRSYGDQVSVGPLSEPVRRVLEIAGLIDWLGGETDDTDGAGGADEAGETAGPIEASDEQTTAVGAPCREGSA
jgi:hypothetical protein